MNTPETVKSSGSLGEKVVETASSPSFGRTRDFIDLCHRGKRDSRGNRVEVLKISIKRPPTTRKVLQVPDPLLKAALLLVSSDFSDVTFIVGAGTDEEKTIDFRLHKFQLILASPVFDAMFNGLLPESGTIRVPDVNPTAFQFLMEYAYCGLVPKGITVELGIATLYAARKYMMDRFEFLLLEVLSADISVPDVLILLDAALLYDLYRLTDLCMDFIDESIEALVVTPEFQELSVTTMVKILQSDNLEITEINLFKALLKWAGLEKRTWLPSGRDLLSPCLPYIRFPTMKASDFANCPAKFLSKEDVGTVLQYICTTEPCKPPCHFNTTPRRGVDIPDDTTEYCECYETGRVCFFCSGRRGELLKCGTVSVGRPVTAQIPPGRSNATSILTATATPPCYCPCRIKGYCPMDIYPRGNSAQLPIDSRTVPSTPRQLPRQPRRPGRVAVFPQRPLWRL